MEVKQININDLEEQELNSNIVPTQIYEKLKQDIATNGCIYPIVVYHKNGKYKIIDGHHRVKVLKELGYDKVNAIIVDVKDNNQALMQAVKLNTERGEQNPKILAQILKLLQEDGFNITKETIYDEPTINDLFDILELQDNSEQILNKQEEEIDLVMYTFIVPKNYQKEIDEILSLFPSNREAFIALCQMMKSKLNNQMSEQ